MANQNIRFASLNAALNRDSEGQLITELTTPNNSQARAVAEIIQRTNADVILINEFDYDAIGSALALFQQNYLAIGQNGAAPVNYPFIYFAPSNTGISSGFDLDNNGQIVTTPGQPGYSNDAFAFGNFPGQFGMVLLSKYPIVNNQVRTFQNFLWQDMPGALLPDNPNTPAANDFYSPQELSAFRLSSKSHWDVPINVNGEIIHVLASHPTPPVFDGLEDRNGRRNHDEIRFWADYIDPTKSNYIRDDVGLFGGLAAGEKFIIMGDQNADPNDGDSFPGAIAQLLNNPDINISVIPSSTGGVDAAIRQGGVNATQTGNPAFDTADFNDNGAGNLRVDYALPSTNLEIKDASVFWPASNEPLFNLVGDFPFPSSDHRLVSLDVAISLPNGVASGDTTQNSTVLWTRSNNLGQVLFEYSTDPNFTTIAGSATATVTDPTLPVKVNIASLNPDTKYYYRATDAAGTSDRGQFQTSAPTGVQRGLRFGVAGDWRGDLLPYPSISNAPERNLEFFVQHGDTVYADIASDAILNPDGTRKGQAETIPEYRAKHQEVYSGDRFGVNNWAKLRSHTSILATIDDHEVINDFSGGENAINDPRFPETQGLINDTVLFENGLQAFQEYNPLRDEFYNNTTDPRVVGERKLYRYNTYGSDGAVIVLDNRSFRDAPLTPVNPTDPTDTARFITESLTLNRTLLGQPQLEEVKQDLLAAQRDGVTWKFIMVPEPIQNFGPLAAGDRYEGYAKERTEILKFINDRGIENVVFVAADIHGTVVNNLTYQEVPGGPQIATNSFEISTGSVAFNEPFGPVVANFALDPVNLAIYNSLPVASDSDSIPNDKDDFLKAAIDQILNPLGYDPIGLNNNLAIADGAIDANLLQGDYFATHTFGWTEFDIDPITQQLKVTTYGIDFYSEQELLADPNAIINRSPQIVSQFTVNTKPQELVFGTSSNDTLDATNPLTNFNGSRDIIVTGAGQDTITTTGSGGRSPIFSGTGNDRILPSTKDLVFAGAGNDTIDASLGGGNNRLYGGEGNDTFLLGRDDLIAGDAGDDLIFVDTGGNNIMTGGAGHDQFWLVNGQIPNLVEGLNIVTDFTPGTDLVAIDLLNLTPNQVSLSQVGSDTIITVNTTQVATLLNTNSQLLRVAAGNAIGLNNAEVVIN